MTLSDKIMMERESLEEIPRFALPEGYSIRPYRPGDEAHWLAIHRDAEHFVPITPTLFAEQFGSDAEELRARQFYLCHGEEVVGTCSAWHDKSYRDGTWGRVHWLAILTAYQGRGLAKPLLGHILTVLRQFGHTKAYLDTLRRREAAVRLYESFGFRVVD